MIGHDRLQGLEASPTCHGDSLRARCLAALTDAPQVACVIADAVALPGEYQRVQPMLTRLAHQGFATITYQGRGLRKRAAFAKAENTPRALYHYRVEDAVGLVDVAVGADLSSATWIGPVKRRQVVDASGSVIGSYWLRYIGKERVAA